MSEDDIPSVGQRTRRGRPDPRLAAEGSRLRESSPPRSGQCSSLVVSIAEVFTPDFRLLTLRASIGPLDSNISPETLVRSETTASGVPSRSVSVSAPRRTPFGDRELGHSLAVFVVIASHVVGCAGWRFGRDTARASAQRRGVDDDPRGEQHAVRRPEPASTPLETDDEVRLRPHHEV